MSKEYKDTWENFWEEAEEVHEKKTGKFAQKPVSPEVFFRDWLGFPLFPKQQKAVNAAFNKNYTMLSDAFTEFVLSWGKGSGKDLTIACLLCYIVYWFCCLNEPQETLGIKGGEPIDVVNVAFDSEQAKSVFFEKFQRLVKNTIDPVTGNNFFESLGMDIEKNIQSKYIQFPKNIRAWSLNSREYKAEGKNIILGVFDEIGSFRFDQAKNIRKHIKTSARTRCPKYYKLFYISYLTSPNDYMAYLLDMAEDGSMDKVYFDRAATWDIRSAKNCLPELKPYVVRKETYQEEYDEDPASAMLMYECKIPKYRSNNFIKRADRITDCILYDHPSPIILPEEDTDKGYSRFWTHNIKDEEFEHWFRPYHTYRIEQLEREYEENPTNEIEDKIKVEKQRHSGAQYYVHIDLSRGVVDCAGLVMGHTYRILDKTKVYVDLMLQIRAPKSEDGTPKEIDLNDILDFVIKVLFKEKKFPIVKVTADGWNSKLFLNICEKNGIEAKMISLEKNTGPYDTLKDFIYRKDINYYLYPPVVRELTELIVTDKHKVDHPRKSKWRMREEGINRGCFHPETKILTCDNKIYSIKDLDKVKDKDIYLFCLDKDNRIVPRKMKKVWITKKTDKLIKITLDNFHEVITTPEHYFKTRGGVWKKACELNILDRLMPIYRSLGSKGKYFKIYDLNSKKWFYEHKYLINKEKSNLEVHHKDLNSLNNNPINLEPLTRSNHKKLHGLLKTKKQLNFMQKKAQEFNLSEKGRKIHSETCKKNHKEGKFLNRRCWMKGKTINDPRVKSLVEAGASARKGNSNWCKGLTKKDNQGLKKLAKSVSKTKLGFDIEKEKSSIIKLYTTFTSPKKISLIYHCSECTIRRYLKLWGVYDKKKYNSKAYLKNKNHKIIGIEEINLDTPIEVYDLEIDDPDIDTFALSAGIFVHNSKDISDCLAGIVASITEESDGEPLAVAGK